MKAQEKIVPLVPLNSCRCMIKEVCLFYFSFFFFFFFFAVVHGTDPSRLDLIVPGEQHFYIKASNPQERQEWLVALGSTKATMGRSIDESGMFICH